MPTPSEHASKSPLRGVWWVVVGLSIITLLGFALYLIGLWLLVFGLLRKVVTYTGRQGRQPMRAAARLKWSAPVGRESL